MGSRTLPDTLYRQCLDFCIRRIEGSTKSSCGAEEWKTIDRLGGSVAEDLLIRAFQLANEDNTSAIKKWKKEWKIFYTSKISSAILSWDENLLIDVRNRCKNLKRVQVVHIDPRTTSKDFNSALVLKCPDTVVTLDFDGELISRGTLALPQVLRLGAASSWLCDSEKILRSILISNARASEYAATHGVPSLSEVHLGNIPAKAEDLGVIIRSCPNLRLLKHYQLASALYKLHSEAWRKKEPLPVYKLKNLDVDFSHVVRCRMSPEWVLAPDALHLAVRLCPRAKDIRIRFDCSTPNDVLAPLVNLESIKEYSAVCVSSGERSLIDFSDMAPILEKHGPKGLTYLELKVIEEVEIHVVMENCAKLDTLVLSGCGYVTPPTCASYNCQSFAAGSFKRLRLLFYADGDDFSWDHGVTECFWKSTLLPSGVNHPVRLEGIFLEYPRIPRSLTSRIFSPNTGRLPFPNLVALSLCRFEEITVDDIASVSGLPSGSRRPTDVCRSLRYVRLSDCEKIDEVEGKRLERWMKQLPTNELRILVD